MSDAIDQYIEYRWDLAEMKRMNRSPKETAALYRRLARQRVRFIVGRLGRRRCS